MAISKKKSANISESSPLCYIDREFYNSSDKHLYGDMCWTFDEAPETLSKDMNRLRNECINGIVYERENNIFDDDPVYLITRKADRTVLEVVVSDNVSNEDFKDAIEKVYGSDIIITTVHAQQKMIDIPFEDASMVLYNQERDKKEIQIEKLLDYVSTRNSEENVKLPVFTVSGDKFNGISWHIGIDGDLYYRLHREDGNGMPGMNFEKINNFLLEGTLDDLTKINKFLDDRKFKMNIEDLLFTEMTVGGDAFDWEFVYICTKDYSKEQMTSLKTSLQARLTEFYNDLVSSGHLSYTLYEQALSGINDDIQAWLGPWPLLAGKMQYKISNFPDKITEKVISKIAEEEMTRHAPLRRSIKNWAERRCEELGLDKSKLSITVKKAIHPHTNKLS